MAGIVVKIWDIGSGNIKKSERQNLQDSLAYILNPEKVSGEVTLPDDFVSKQMGRECKYVANDIKTVDGAYVGTRNVIADDPAHATDEMMQVKRFYDKIDGRAAVHGMISLPESESDIKNAPKLMQLCEDVMAELYPRNQVIYAVHTNTDNLHIHFIVNAVGLDGRKVHKDRMYIKQKLQPAVNKAAEKYGFTPNDKWCRYYKNNVTHFAEIKMDCRQAIDLAIERAEDFEDFIAQMQSMDYDIRVHKHITVQNEFMDKPIRTHQLGANYTPDAIAERIAHQRDAFVVPDKVNVHAADVTARQATYSFKKMKRYKEMSPAEKKEILRQIRLGYNPWRVHNNNDWAISAAIDKLNRDNIAHTLITYYAGDSGGVQQTLDAILDAKKALSAEQKSVREILRRYKPEIDLYKQMQELAQAAYLYEHESVAEYRKQYDDYRKYTRRLNDNYGKSINDVAEMYQACQDNLDYAKAQLAELSQEYREVRDYGIRTGKIAGDSPSLYALVNNKEMRREAKDNVYHSGSYFVASANCAYFVHVSHSPEVVNGRMGENTRVTVVTRDGTVVDRFNSAPDLKSFNDKLYALQKQYDFKDCIKCSDIAAVKAVFAQGSTPVETKPYTAGTVTFTQAVNINSAKKEIGTHVFYSVDNPMYIAEVVTAEDMITVGIYDKSDALVDTLELPQVREATTSGWTTLNNAMLTYGFTDFNCVTDNRQIARDKIKAQEEKKEEKRENAARSPKKAI